MAEDRASPEGARLDVERKGQGEGDCSPAKGPAGFRTRMLSADAEIRRPML
jgi:hypothetical protein